MIDRAMPPKRKRNIKNREHNEQRWPHTIFRNVFGSQVKEMQSVDTEREEPRVVKRIWFTGERGAVNGY